MYGDSLYSVTHITRSERRTRRELFFGQRSRVEGKLFALRISAVFLKNRFSGKPPPCGPSAAYAISRVTRKNTSLSDYDHSFQSH